MRRHWFFDFDGTLCDTEADIKSAWRAALRNLGRDCPHFDRVYRTGPTLDQVVYMLFDDATPELVDAVKAQFRTCYDAGGFPATRPYPWVPGWIADLKRQGCHVYVATNKRWNPTRLLMAKFGWDKSFDGFYSFDSFLDPAVAAAHPGAPQRFLSKAELLAEVMRERGIDPASVPAALVRSHGPFTWGKTPAKAVENAVVLEELAFMAWHDLALDPDIPDMPRALLDKHYLRKHGASAYYGQK